MNYEKKEPWASYISSRGRIVPVNQARINSISMAVNQNFVYTFFVQVLFYGLYETSEFHSKSLAYHTALNDLRKVCVCVCAVFASYDIQ